MPFPIKIFRIFRTNNRWAVLVPLFTWALTILIYALTPAAKLRRVSLGNYDKIAHFFGYTLLAVLLLNALYRVFKVRSAILLILFTLIFAGCYGIVIELMQSFVPGRDVEMADFLANMGGILLGLIAIRGLPWPK